METKAAHLPNVDTRGVILASNLREPKSLDGFERHVGLAGSRVELPIVQYRLSNFPKRKRGLGDHGFPAGE